MISKVITGHSFRGSILYIMQEQKHAQVLKVEGVRGHDKKLMIEDFLRQHALRPEKKQACFHGILSFYPGEKPADKTIVDITEQYLKGLNITNTQFAVVKHTDKDHLHVHVIANMVNNYGKTIGDNWIGLKGKKLAQQLTKEHKLVQALSKKLELTHYKSFRVPQQFQYQIYEAIKNNLPACRTMEDLQIRLKQQGIDMFYKYKGQTNEVQGISFKLGEYKFKGSKIDRQYSFSNLKRTFGLQQNLIEQQVNRYQTLQDSTITNDLLRHSTPQTNFQEPINAELLQQAKRKRKKQKHRL